MPIDKDKFINLIEEIVHSEMSEDEQSQFDIEGRDLFDGVFDSSYEETKSEGSKTFVYGISPEAIDAIKVITTFGSLIISIVSLYLNFSGNKNQTLKVNMERLEIEAKLKEEMLKNKMAPELVDKINNKYGEQLTKILNQL